MGSENLGSETGGGGVLCLPTSVSLLPYAYEHNINMQLKLKISKKKKPKEVKGCRGQRTCYKDLYLNIMSSRPALNHKVPGQQTSITERIPTTIYSNYFKTFSKARVQNMNKLLTIMFLTWSYVFVGINLT